MQQRALISVSDKTGLEALGKGLHACGFQLVSTGGTAETLRSFGLQVTDVSVLTGLPEMLGGRVKTLHPGVHAGLLAKRDDAAHMQALTDHGFGEIDIVVVNLYPFEATYRTTENATTRIENIDIGGPAMIRAAAKNHVSVTVVVDPEDYDAVLSELHADGATSLALRQKLAAKAFARTAAYDAAIGFYLSADAGQALPEYVLGAKKISALSYGENPHQAAALYGFGEGGLAAATQLHGKALSYNNLRDADAAYGLLRGQTQPSAVLVKHTNPCGVAVASSIEEAFTRALASDPVSAFGGILAINRPVTRKLVEAIGSLFLEVIIAPGYDADALAHLQANKKNLRLLQWPEAPVKHPLAGMVVQAIAGGFLLQTADDMADNMAAWKCVTSAQPSEAQLTDAALAWRVVRGVTSNAIALVKHGQTIGIGAGQMNRVGAVRIALDAARTHGHDPRGSVLASDAFFPFADNVALAAEAGIALMVHPGGSMRDAEVIAAAEAAGIAMLLTGRRHFRH